MESPRKRPGPAPRDGPPERQIALSLPEPLSVRLDGLLLILRQAHEPASRKDLVGALIQDAGLEASWLETIVDRYRTATVGDAVINGQSPQAYVRASSFGSGPRTRDQLYVQLLAVPPSDQAESNVRGNDLLAEAERIRVGVSLPLNVDGRLDELLGELNATGYRSTRSELVSALILAYPATGVALIELVRAYMRSLAPPPAKPPTKKESTRKVARRGGGGRRRE